VMEGKGVLFKRFADIDVFDLEVATADVDHFCAVVKALEPTFGGINLEDIKAPDCFRIEARLTEELEIPVFHDDQHGTAIITSAALLNGLELAGKNPGDVRVVFSGAGAAALACARMLTLLGVEETNILVCDSRGVLTKDREAELNEFKKPFARESNAKTLAEALVGADVFIGLSAANLVTPEMIAPMADKPLIFALANPDPEIAYPLAREARPDAIVATGRSDFPNQVNNVLCFPFIFRGALDVRARKINDRMKLAAVHSLAELARRPVPETVSLAYGGKRFEFGPDYIIPKPMDPRVLLEVTPAVARAACESGVARHPIEDWVVYQRQLERRLGKDTEILRVATQKARTVETRIVFPEGDFDPVLKAAAMMVEDRIAVPVLVGPEGAIRARIDQLDLGQRLSGVEVHDPESSPLYDPFCEQYFELRQRKGVTRLHARRRLRWRMYFASMMLRSGHVDGMVAGLGSTYPEMLRPLFQIVGTDARYSHVAGVQLVLFKNELLFFADTTAIIDPTAEELAEIGISTARFARRFDVTPRIGFLSFSTFGSAPSAEAARVRRAVEIVRERAPELEVEGEMQVDVALSAELRQQQYPFARLTANPNVLVFPNLGAGNIAYKIAGQMGAGFVLGPFLVGLDSTVTLLSPGATASEVFQSAVVTAMRAGSKIAHESTLA